MHDTFPCDPRDVAPGRYVPGPDLPPETLPLEPADVRVSPEGRLDVRYYIERNVQVGRCRTTVTVLPACASRTRAHPCVFK